MDAHHARRGLQIRARFDADPASVPCARRFVADGLTAWGQHALLDDATLCVSELAGNAALHSESTFMEVSLCHAGEAVRLAVEDDGAVPASAVAVRGDLHDRAADVPGAERVELDELDRLLAEQPATGRGLAIVSVLARDWGVEALENGKRVWAELWATTSPDDRPDASTSITRSSMLAPTPGGEDLPEGWTVVRFLGCPVELSLEQDDHLDALIREVQLMHVDDANTGSSRLADRLAPILQTPASARQAGRRQAEQAAERGERHVDVEVAVPPGSPDAVLELGRTVRMADELSEGRQMLTLPSSQAVRELRAWFIEEVVAQAGHGAAPTPWDDWRRAR